MMSLSLLIVRWEEREKKIVEQEKKKQMKPKLPPKPGKLQWKKRCAFVIVTFANMQYWGEICNPYVFILDECQLSSFSCANATFWSLLVKYSDYLFIV